MESREAHYYDHSSDRVPQPHAAVLAVLEAWLTVPEICRKLAETGVHVTERRVYTAVRAVVSKGQVVKRRLPKAGSAWGRWGKVYTTYRRA
jgi:hypothetical protein